MLINIITVTYNSEKTITRTLNSVLNQKEQNINYIIIDGASTDSTLDILNHFYPLFKKKGISYNYFSEPDDGIYHAMNKGISHVKKGFTTFLNSDDWLDNNFVRIINQYANSDESIYFGNITCIDTKEQFFFAKPRFPLWRMYDQMCIFHPGTCIGINVFKRVGLYDLQFSLSADYDFFLRAYKHKVSFKYLDYNLAYFFLEGSSKKKRKIGLIENQSIRKKNKIFFRHFFNFKENYLSPIFYKIKHELFLGKK